MNISQENIDALNAKVTIEFAKADYEPKAEAALKSFRKKVSMPGFRPGNVPTAMVKKLYGKSILAEEINKLVSETINNYVRDNSINILGEPIPSEDMEPIDFDKEIDNVVFKFDLGLAPKIEIDFDKIEVPSYTIDIDDKMIATYNESVVSRLGKMEEIEVSSEKSLIKGSLAQEGGKSNDSTVLAVSNIQDEGERAKFVGKKVGDAIVFDIQKALKPESIAYALGASKEESEQISGDYTFTVSEVNEFINAELNQETFDRVFGTGQVNGIEEYTAKVKEQLAFNCKLEQEYRFQLDVRKAVLDALQLQLPEEFLKRWLTLVNQGNEKFTPDVLVNEFPIFVEDLKWQVVKSDVMKKNDLKLDQNDIHQHAKKLAVAQFHQYGLDNMPEQYLDNYANEMLKKKEEVERATEGAVNDKVAAFLKEKVKLSEKTISQEEFDKLFEK